MSKIGKKIIIIPEGISVEIKDGKIDFQNTKGEILNLKILPGVLASVQDKTLSFTIEKKIGKAGLIGEQQDRWPITPLSVFLKDSVKFWKLKASVFGLKKTANAWCLN